MRIVRMAATAVLGATLAVGGFVLVDELRPLWPKRPRPQPDAETLRWYRLTMGNTPGIAPGIRLPGSVPAEESRLADDDLVIGIEVDGICRAYSVSAMSIVTSHVVNDVVNGRPVSVSYCDRLDTARAFTSDTATEPLTVGVGGWFNSEMNIRLNGRFYPQLSETIPLDDYPFEKTTWKSWREAHPDTEVVTELENLESALAG
jgi:hypothetical protein